MFSFIISIQTSSPLSIFLSGSPQCERIQIAERTGSIDIEIPDDTWQTLIDCGEENGVKGIIYVHLENGNESAEGKIKLIGNPREVIMRTQITENKDGPNSFFVSESIPYSRKIKLQSLSDTVKIGISSENQENALEVYITFCPTNKGILYTTSYAPDFEIILKSPRMEMYYDAYSCDSNIAFYSNSSRPTSPLIIRLESQFSINGTMTVLINGEEPSDDIHVADYETGTFHLEKDEMKIVELKYQPMMKKIQAFLDVVSGSMSVYLSPCKTQETDNFYSILTPGTHRINIDLETIMDNTTCSLMEINPSTIYMFLKPSATTKFSLWIPGRIATWHLIITIGLVLLFLTACMILIIHFGRKKTGKLVINHLQK
uniref:Uncharacterized protein n=1 Tax=Caenorhabditis tropicalis TaxID=1561998 RepID=A0A1I7UZM9_9PELO